MTDEFAGSQVRKRSVTINGHPTSVALEDAFWVELRQIAKVRKLSINQLVSDVDGGRATTNLSSALRLFVLDALKTGNRNKD